MAWSHISSDPHSQDDTCNHDVVELICDHAIIDAYVGCVETIVPLGDHAPAFYTPPDKFNVDVSTLDEAMRTRPNTPILRLFLTNFNDDFDFYSKVYRKTK
jgi:hypothetical protein